MRRALLFALMVSTLLFAWNYNSTIIDSSFDSIPSHIKLDYDWYDVSEYHTVYTDTTTECERCCVEYDEETGDCVRKEKCNCHEVPISSDVNFAPVRMAEIILDAKKVRIDYDYPVGYESSLLDSMEHKYEFMDKAIMLNSKYDRVQSAYSALRDKLNHDALFDSVIHGSLTGAIVGGGAGSVVGGIGVVPGAVVGAVFGAVAGAADHYLYDNYAEVRLSDIPKDMTSLKGADEFDNLESAVHDYLAAYVDLHNYMIDTYNKDVGQLNSMDAQMRDMGLYDENYNGKYLDNVNELYNLKASLYNFTTLYSKSMGSVNDLTNTIKGANSAQLMYESFANLIVADRKLHIAYWNSSNSFVVFMSRYERLANETIEGVFDEYSNVSQSYLDLRSKYHDVYDNIDMYSGVTYEDFKDFDLGGTELDSRVFDVLNNNVNPDLYKVNDQCLGLNEYNYKGIVPCTVTIRNSIMNMGKNMYGLQLAESTIDSLYPRAEQEVKSKYDSVKERCNLISIKYPLAGVMCDTSLSEAEKYLEPPENMRYKDRLDSLNTARNILDDLNGKITNESYLNMESLRADSLDQVSEIYSTLLAMKNDGIPVDNLLQELRSVNYTLSLPNLDETNLNVSLKSLSSLRSRIGQLQASQYGLISSDVKGMYLLYSSLGLINDPNYIQLSNFVDSAGNLDYSKVVGNFSLLKGVIDSMKLSVDVKARKFIEEAFERSLYVSYDADKELVLNELVSERIVVDFSSSLAISYSDPLSLSLDLPMDVSGYVVESVSNGIDVIPSGHQLNINMRSYRPGSYQVVLVRESRPAYSLSDSFVCGEATLDSVECTRKLSVYVDGDYKGIVIPIDLGSDYQIFVDGYLMGTSNGDFKYNHYLSKGTHDFEFQFDVKSPLSVDVDVRREGVSSVVEYSIVPSVDGVNFSAVRLSLDLPSDAPQNPKLNAQGCIIRNYTISDNVIEVFLYGLKDECKLKLEAVMKYDPEVVSSSINEKLNDDEYSDVREDLERALSYVNSGDVENAYKKYIDAINKHNENIRDKEISRVIDKRIDKIDSNVKSIGDALGDDPEIKETLNNVNELIEKAKSSSNVTEKQQYVKNASSLLDSVREKVHAIKLNLTSELNDVKNIIADASALGVSDSELQADVSELQDELNKVDVSSLTGLERINVIKSKIESVLDKAVELRKEADDSRTEILSGVSEHKKSLKILVSTVKSTCGDSCPSDLIARADTLLSLEPADEYEAKRLLSSIESVKSSLQDYVKASKESADVSISRLNVLLSRLSDSEKAKYSGEIQSIKDLYSKAHYYEASKKAEELIAKIGPRSSKTGDYTLILAGIALIAMAGLVVKFKDKLHLEGEKNKSDENEIELKTLRREED